MKNFNPIKTPIYKDGSEVEHQKMLNHFQEKFNRDVFKKSPAEKEELSRAKSQHANGKHKPDNSNVSFTREGD